MAGFSCLDKLQVLLILVCIAPFMATVHIFVIVARGILGVGDALVLLVIFGSYPYMAKRSLAAPCHKLPLCDGTAWSEPVPVHQASSA